MKKGKNIIINLAGVLIIPVVLLLSAWLVEPTRVSIENIIAILLQASTLSMVAWGMIFQITAGTMNLDMGAVYVFSAVIGGNISLRLEAGILGTAVICIVTGLICGIMSGGVFGIFKIPSFIVSIAMMMIFECVSCAAFSGHVNMPSSMLISEKMPYAVLFPLLSFLVSYFLFNMTKLGSHSKAVGFNAKVAEMNGVKLIKTKVLCFVVAGGFTGFYAFYQLGKVGYVSGVQNMGSLTIVFDAMMSCFLSLAVGIYINPIICIYLCAIILQTTKYCLLILGLNSIYQPIVVGVLVLILLGITGNKERMFDWADRLRLRSAKNISINS